MEAEVYTGKFEAEHVRRVLDAAKPIPTDDIEIDDYETGEKLRVPRAVALIKRLESIDVLTQINLQHLHDLSPSDLEKRFHAIAAAANELLVALGGGRDTEIGDMPRQIRDGLRREAERDGERRNGFEHHPPRTFSIDGEEFRDYQGDSQLRDNIAAVRQLRAWAMNLERAAAAQKGKKNDDLEEWLNPWTGEPLSDALAGILRIWTDVLGREVRTSVTMNGRATGPLLRFVEACLAALNLRSQGDGPSTNALRARILRMYAADFQKSGSGHIF